MDKEILDVKHEAKEDSVLYLNAINPDHHAFMEETHDLIDSVIDKFNKTSPIRQLLARFKNTILDNKIKYSDLKRLNKYLKNIQSITFADDLPLEGKTVLKRAIAAFKSWGDNYFKAKLTTDMANQDLNKLSGKLKLIQSQIDLLLEQAESKINRLEHQREQMYIESEKRRDNQVRLVSEEFKRVYNQGKQEISELESKAEYLVNLISSNGMTGRHIENARRERNSAISWEIITVLSFVGLIAFSLLYFLNADKALEITWQVIVSRILVASTFAILGTYAASKASRHRKIEAMHTQLEIELFSLGLYLEGLSEEVKEKLKEKLTDRYFGNFNHLEFKDTHPIPHIELCQILLSKLDSQVLKEVVSKLEPKNIKEGIEVLLKK